MRSSATATPSWAALRDRSPHLLLVGMMGAGKTTIGRGLAARLGRALLDSDAEVERSTGRGVREIFEREGEGAFRREESRVLREATERHDPSVIAVAGGAVLDPGNRALIAAAGLVVWLRADPDVLVHRVGEGLGRPLLGDDPKEAIHRLYEMRAPLYASIADVIVDVDGRSPSEVVDEIASRVEDPA